MTREQFKEQSDKIFFQVKEGLKQKILEDTSSSFEEYSKNPNDITLQKCIMEVLVSLSVLSFEASCDYSENLALLLFDQESK